MKNITIIIIALLAIHTAPLTLHAAFPLRWNVETSRVQPAQFDVYRGETLDLEVSFQSYGKPLAVTGPAALYYQTNGMGAAWWTAPATVASNTISASFAPALDPGAPILNCFLGGAASTYRAAFRLRYLNSPGATPNLLPLPIVTYDARLNGAPTINGTNLIDFVIAASGAEVDPTVPDWAKQPNPPQSGTDEATVKAIINAEVGGTNTLAHGGPYLAADGRAAEAGRIGDGETWTDATGCVWSVEKFYSDEWVTDSAGNYLVGWNEESPYPTGWYVYFYDTSVFEYGISENRYATVITTFEGIVFNRVLDHLGTNFVGRVALTNDIPRTATQVGAYPAASGAALQNTVNAWQTYWDGDDVRVTVTNYYGSQDLPSLYIEQKITEGGTNYYKTIWTEKARLNVILDRLLQIESDVATKADRAWGFYDSHSGTYAPDGFTSISSESILISKDMSYQKTVTSAGEVWVLTATDPTVITGATNGFFRISDSEGNSIIEVVKGDKRTVPATFSAANYGNSSFTVTFNVVSSEHPTIEVCDDLTDQNWIAEGEAGFPATVAWSGASGAWVATFTGIQTMDKMFVKGTYEVGGETYARHGVPLGVDRVVIGGVYYRVAVETVNGKKLMVLTEL